MSTNGYVLNSSTSDEDIHKVRPNSSAGPGLIREIYTNGIGVQHTSVSNTVEKAAKMLELLMKTRQQICLKGSSTDVTHGIHAADVEIVVGPDNQTKGSSKVKIKNIVHYSWEHKYYNGNIVAVHMNGHHMAYCIKNTGKNESCVRILNRKTTQRALLKRMHGQVKDLSFAHSANQILLAIVDEAGVLFVYQVTESDPDMSIRCSLVLQVNRLKAEPCEHRRVSWCHYHPDDTQLIDDTSEESNLPVEDYTKLLVVTHDETIEMLNLDMINKEQGKEITTNDLDSGYQKIVDHTKPISEAIFAPDGSALATASLDGQVKFFQVYLHEKSSTPRLLHQWEPHNGRPVTALFFLDNHKDQRPDQAYWKFAVTGTDDNREIKIWCCVDWTCLQMIRFQVPAVDKVQPCLKAALDLSAEYLLLSDINRRVLYVLQFHQEPDLSKACIVSLSEFPLNFPMLSYAIRQAGIKRVKRCSDPSENLELEEKGDSDHDDENSQEMAAEDYSHNEETVIKLLFVQPKSLQECSIGFPTSRFLPQKNGDDVTLAAMSQESITSYKDGLSDLSIDRTIDVSCTEEELAAVTPTISSINQLPKTQVLLTPDSFTSPSINHCTSTLSHLSPGAKTTPKSNNLNSSSNEILTPGSLPLPPVSSNEEESLQEVGVGALVDIDEQQPLATSERINNHEISDGAVNMVQRSHHSSSSSPSREVEEILSPESNNSDYKCTIRNDQSDVVDTAADHYKSTTWPAAPNIEKIAQQTSPRETVGKAQPVVSDSEIMEQLVSQKKMTEELIKEFKKREKILDGTVQSMLTVLQDQQEELKSQKATITSLKDDLKKNQSNVEQEFKSHIDIVRQRQDASLKQAIDTCLTNKHIQDKQSHDHMMASLSQLIISTIENKMYKVIKSELKSAVFPMLSKIFEPTTEQLQADLIQRMASIENNLKETTNRVIKSKATTDAIGNSVGAVIQNQVTQSYHEAFQNVFFPMFEKTSQVMFEQLNENFQRGTKDYLVQVENQLRKKREDDDRVLNFNKTQLQNVNDSVKMLASTVNTQYQTLTEIQKAMSSQQEVLCSSVISAMRSGAVTPVHGAQVATLDPHTQQQQIQMLIKQGQINAAFQQALSASDLSLVILVCQAVDPNEVFNQQPCPLDQPIILSLIQQLSTDLSSDTELKHKYLEEALMNIDHRHTITKDHLPAILDALRQKLEHFIMTSTNPSLTKKMKILLMAAKSL